MDKSVETLTALMGIVYAGSFYVSVSTEQPDRRILQILEITKADCIITLDAFNSRIRELGYTGRKLSYNQMIESDVAEESLSHIRKTSQDTDPLYCNFTSGSTGIPKGVLVSHRSVIDFMEDFPSMFGITKEDIIGNQAPFDFDVSVKDIYSTLKVGATMIIIPKKLFSIPPRLLDFLCEHEITTLIWAVSALCMISQLKGFTYKVPSRISKVLFSGEAMPVSQLKIWQTYLPHAHFINLYGPTEITCNCTYYFVDRDFELNETIPIGRPFPNEKVFLLDKDNNLVMNNGDVGEICVAGTALALGYYNNPEQTRQAFVQNPLNNYYIEPIYRTGDLAFYNKSRELCFSGRKDFQIKHMGHRIELEEIETVLNSYPFIQRACCLFDPVKKRILAFYSGDMDKKELSCKLRESLPSYMIPSVFYPMPQLPLSPNGKIDRKNLLEMSQ